MKQQKNQELIKGLKRNEEQSFRNVYDKYNKTVYAIALKYLKEKSLARDAVHDVFIQLWEYRQNLDEQQSLKGFLVTSTKNHVLNMIRNKKRDNEKNERYSRLKPLSQNRTFSKLTLKNYKQVFQNCLKKLPDGKREIFELKMNKGITNKKIAEKLDISVNTVKSQYYKASKFIKEELSKRTELDLK